ncbi:MAG: hypothetical protein ACRER2_08440 [Methylococcales bacterium]
MPGDSSPGDSSCSPIVKESVGSGCEQRSFSVFETTGSTLLEVPLSVNDNPAFGIKDSIPSYGMDDSRSNADSVTTGAANGSISGTSIRALMGSKQSADISLFGSEGETSVSAEIRTHAFDMELAKFSVLSINSDALCRFATTVLESGTTNSFGKSAFATITSDTIFVSGISIMVFLVTGGRRSD